MRYWVISHIEDFKLGDQVATYKNTQKIKIRFSPKVVLYNDFLYTNSSDELMLIPLYTKLTSSSSVPLLFTLCR